MHRPSRNTYPRVVGQLVVQTPFKHDCPVAHATPHAPQWVTLVRRSAQLVPHARCGGGHCAPGPQRPATHASLAAQRTPQAPQSVAVATLVSQPLAADPSQSA